MRTRRTTLLLALFAAAAPAWAQSQDAPPVIPPPAAVDPFAVALRLPPFRLGPTRDDAPPRAAAADRETIVRTAVGAALLGCAIGVFMDPPRGTAFGCGVGALAGGVVGALIGSGL